MPDQTAREDYDLWCAETNAICNAPEVGEQLLPGYLLNDLELSERCRMEQHLLDCEYCRLGVANWKTLASGMRSKPIAKKALAALAAGFHA